MHVDGFRFDLATTLGRVGAGEFDRDAPIFQIINQDPVLSQVKLIAEPWDVGMGGYQLGNFPNRWREWNGRYRDTLRKYWKGDQNLASQLGYRLSGSADIYQGERRQPQTTINFITAHDGFTLHDLVSYNVKHNEANGEDNRDGSDDNDSWNHGAEGETADPQIIELRERQKRNLLASLFMSQGVPMIVAGDEMGRTQGGNNNAYCQDNEISWIDWRLDERKQRLLEFTRRLIALRAELPVLQRRRFFVGDYIWDSRSKDLTWLRPDGVELSPLDWQRPWLSSLAFMLGGDAIPTVDERGERLLGDGVLVLTNPHHEPIRFHLPEGAGGNKWTLQFDTSDDKNRGVVCTGDYRVQARAMAVLRQPIPAEAMRGKPSVEWMAEADTAPRATMTLTPERRIRRAGVLVPLFSLRRKGNWGIGEIADIPKFAAWAERSGFSILQLLPVNAVGGYDASPYAAISAFALDPVYLCLDQCEDFTAAGGRDALPPAMRDELRALEASDLVRWDRVRALKREGIRIAFERFLRDEWQSRTGRARELGNFMKNSRTWLDDYALFSVIHEQRQESWRDWPLGIRERTPDAISQLRRERANELLAVAWVQWQLDRQWNQARLEASQHDVELMGDLPFTVSMDSADVWANRSIFRCDLHVGTPPEEGSPSGQDWGLPAYDWGALQKSDFSWLRGRVARAGQLFSLYRIDHALGFYRMFYRSPDGKTMGFSPTDERQQIRLGELVMRLMRHFGEVVAEDLGNVPPFLRPSLERLGIPGYRVLRWEKDGEEYRDPQAWPVVSVATSSTHDTSTNADWYDELSVDERKALAKIPALSKLDPNRGFDDAARDAILRAVYQAPSTLALVMFQDAMGARERINVPGTVAETNWSYRMPMTIEDLATDTGTSARLRQLASDTHRAEPASESKPNAGSD
jgi:4-alpha-glucanotransferase